MATLSKGYCANKNASVGFKFLGYILNLVDTNKDGVNSCAEYNVDQGRKTDIIKKKPECPLAASVTLKHAHGKA